MFSFELTAKVERGVDIFQVSRMPLQNELKTGPFQQNKPAAKNSLNQLKKISKSSHMEITVQELRNRLQSGEPFVFIDVREPWEYEEFNLGAQLIPLNTLVSNMQELEDHKEDEIIVHCRSGARSAMAQGLLLANGFKKVLNLKGGVLAWQEAFGNTRP